MSSVAESIASAAPAFTGQVLGPADDGYHDVRRVHNGLIDKHSAVIARCHGVADVVDAVQLARALDLEVSIRGGGHNVAGRATIDQGLMIDLSPMKGIHVDPRARTVHAHLGGPCERRREPGSLLGYSRRWRQLWHCCVARVHPAPGWPRLSRLPEGRAQLLESAVPDRPERRCDSHADRGLAATRYVNYLEEDAPNPAAVAYGPNLARLRAIKTE